MSTATFAGEAKSIPGDPHGVPGPRPQSRQRGFDSGRVTAQQGLVVERDHHLVVSTTADAADTLDVLTAPQI